MKKTVLISGGKRGIGKAIAQKLAADYQVYAPSSQEMNVSCQESIDEYFRHNKIKSVDILVNNAGVLIKKAFLEHSEEDWQKLLSINLMGIIKLSQKVIPMMQTKSWGRIVNISSISGIRAEAFASAYTASKFAVNGLSQSMALEFANDNITVNAICPGWVKTDMGLSYLFNNESKGLLEKYNASTADQALKDKETMLLGSVLQKRWIEAEEVAAMLSYLISEEAKAVTGQALTISAGLDL